MLKQYTTNTSQASSNPTSLASSIAQLSAGLRYCSVVARSRGRAIQFKAGLGAWHRVQYLAISRLPNSLLFSILGIFVRIAESNHLHAAVTGSDVELMKSREGTVDL
jgi:hypothetical protein